MRMHCIDIEAKGTTIQVEPDEEDKQEQKVPLRDRVFSKADITKLTKRKWIEVKDLIFETDKNIL